MLCYGDLSKPIGRRRQRERAFYEGEDANMAGQKTNLVRAPRGPGMADYWYQSQYDVFDGGW